MDGKKMIPIGVEDFEKLRRNDYYYVDKTGLIRDLLQNRTDVTLFTRPRRFGKSLNMSMLKHFFSVDGDKSIFDGLEISREKELCEKHMGKYPAIFLSLKDVEGEDYEEAFQALTQIINEVAKEASYLADSHILDEQDKADYRMLQGQEISGAWRFIALGTC